MILRPCTIAWGGLSYFPLALETRATSAFIEQSACLLPSPSILAFNDHKHAVPLGILTTSLPQIQRWLGVVTIGETFRDIRGTGGGSLESSHWDCTIDSKCIWLLVCKASPLGLMLQAVPIRGHHTHEGLLVALVHDAQQVGPSEYTHFNQPPNFL